MRRLVTADIHISKNPIDAYRLVFLKENLPALVDKYKPDELLVLGDITQDKDLHPASVVNEVVGAFYNLAKRCKVIILQGNHDASAVEYPFFEFLNCIDNIQWIRAPTEQDNCLYLPHTRDHKKDWQGLSFEDRDFIFAHNTFTGAKANGQTLSGIPLSVFPDDACVLSGDIHEPQTLGPVTYIGSPCLCTFGENFQPRILLLDGLQAKSIKVHGQQKRLLQLDWQAGGMAKLAQSANEGDIVKINVIITSENIAEWGMIRQEVGDWACKNKFIVNSIIPIVEYIRGDRKKASQSSVQKSDIEFITSFVKRFGVDASTAKVGLEILEK